MSNITLQPVSSSLIAAIGHDPDTDTLAVAFHTKKNENPVYHYAGFTVADYDAFRGAESIGKHFLQNIKGKYEYTKQESA